MAKVLSGDTANSVLIEKEGITRNQLQDKLELLYEAAVGISDDSPLVMLNLFAQSLSAMIVYCEQNGEPDILPVVLKAIESSVMKLRASNKKEAN